MWVWGLETVSRRLLLALVVCCAGSALVNGAVAQVATANLDVSITITNACTIGAAGMNFGSRGLLSANVDTSAALTVNCSKNTAYSIGLDSGQNASGSVRRMSAGGEYVSYTLYQDASRSLAWGSAQGAQLPGTGSGSTQSLMIYGRVAPQATPPSGTYTDTVVVSINY